MNGPWSVSIGELLAMVDLNIPVQPDTLDPLPQHPIVGNIHDDDGQAIDQYFEAPPHQPLDYSQFATTVDENPVCTRLIVKTYTLVSPDGVVYADPVQVLPADPNRKELWVDSSASNLTIASSKSDCYSLATFRHQTTDFCFYSLTHTGPVWIYYTPLVVTTAGNFTIRAVTL